MQTQTIEFVTVVKDGVVQQVGKAVIEQSRTNFKGNSDSIKWYEDKPKKEGVNHDRKRPADYTECNCSKCQEKENCIHKDAYRRLPKEIGGLGLCKNLKK